MIVALEVVEATASSSGSAAGPGLASNPRYDVLITLDGVTTSKPVSVSHTYEEFDELQQRLADKYPGHIGLVTADFPRKLRRNTLGIPAAGHQAEVRCFKLHRVCSYVNIFICK